MWPYGELESRTPAAADAAPTSDTRSDYAATMQAHLVRGRRLQAVAVAETLSAFRRRTRDAVLRLVGRLEPLRNPSRRWG